MNPTIAYEEENIILSSEERTFIKEDKKVLTYEEIQKSKELHRQAAINLEEAAKNHHDAVGYHHMGDHDQAIIRMMRAIGFVRLATELQNENLMYMSRALVKY